MKVKDKIKQFFLKKLEHKKELWIMITLCSSFFMLLIGLAKGELEGYARGISKLPKPEKEYIAYYKEHAFIANTESMVYHINHCFSLPNEEKRIYFDNENIAKENGYRPCRNCFGEKE